MYRAIWRVASVGEGDDSDERSMWLRISTVWSIYSTLLYSTGMPSESWLRDDCTLRLIRPSGPSPPPDQPLKWLPVSPSFLTSLSLPLSHSPNHVLPSSNQP